MVGEDVGYGSRGTTYACEDTDAVVGDVGRCVVKFSSWLGGGESGVREGDVR